MPAEIVDDVWDITCLDEPAGKRYRSFLFTDGTPTLIDAGLETTTDTLIDAIEEIGTRPERLILTHGDGDHVGGFDKIVAEYEPETHVPEQTTYDFAEPPDHRYGHGASIGRFEAVHLPGHEPDNHGLVDEDAGIAVMGDALSGADQRGLPRGYFVLPPAVYTQDLNQAEESLDRLLDYEFSVGLVFHGESVLEDASEKVERFVNFPGK